MDLVTPPAKEPPSRRQGERAASCHPAYVFREHFHTTPGCRVLFPAILGVKSGSFLNRRVRVRQEGAVGSD